MATITKQLFDDYLSPNIQIREGTKLRCTVSPNCNCWIVPLNWCQIRIMDTVLKYTHTDLSSLIGNFDCGYSTVWGILMILLPLWFYVKSILGDFIRSKSVILTILESLNVNFLRISLMKMSQISKNCKIQSCSIVQNGSF